MAYKIWTKEEEDLLKELVASGKYSFRQMEKFFTGRSFGSLTCHAGQYLNIFNDKYEQRKYSYDESFFESPNILNSYVAGFLAADGCLQLHAKQGPTLSLEVSDLDLNHIQKLKDVLKHQGPITWHPNNGKNTVKFKISCSYKYYNDLGKNFGIIPRKANHLSPPQLNNLDLRLSFMIGLLDGDGCVHICSSNNNLSISFVSSSEKAVKWYKDCMEEFKFPSIQRNTRVPSLRKLSYANAYHISFVGARAVSLIKLVQSFYKAHNLPILTRKWDNPKINSYIDQFQQKYPQYLYNPPDFSVSPIDKNIAALAA